MTKQIKIRVRKKKKKDVLSWLWEFSKKVVTITTALYFISFLYALVVCYRAIDLVADTTALTTLITEANETYRVVVGGYLIKAAVENAVKIATAKQEKKSAGGNTEIYETIGANEESNDL